MTVYELRHRLAQANPEDEVMITIESAAGEFFEATISSVDKDGAVGFVYLEGKE